MVLEAVAVSLQRAAVGGEDRPSQVVAEEEAGEGAGLLPLLLCWEQVEQVEHEERVGPPGPEDGWRVVVEEVKCCVRVYWGVLSARAGEEVDPPGLRSEREVVVGQHRGQEGAEEKEGPCRLWTVLEWEAGVLSGRVKEGEWEHLSQAPEGGAPVCPEQGEGHYLC